MDIMIHAKGHHYMIDFTHSEDEAELYINEFMCRVGLPNVSREQSNEILHLSKRLCK